MIGNRSLAGTWVIVEVRKQPFAAPASAVHEIVSIPTVTRVPGAAPQWLTTRPCATMGRFLCESPLCSSLACLARSA